MKKIFLLLIALSLLSGCASTMTIKAGSKTLTAENIAKITPGLSKQEVLVILGEPANKMNMPPLPEFWTYSYSEQKIAYAPVYKPFQPTRRSGEVKTVTVYFDSEGKVNNVGQTSMNPYQQIQVEFGQ